MVGLEGGTYVPCFCAVIAFCYVVVPFAMSAHCQDVRLGLIRTSCLLTVEYLIPNFLTTPLAVLNNLMLKPLPLSFGMLWIVVAIGVI